MSDYVWILQSGMLAGNSLQADFLSDVPMDRPGTEEEAAREREMHAILEKGHLMPDKYVPKNLISTFSDSKVKLDRDFFEVGFFIAVSSRLHDVMKSFDYGGGGFHPVLPYRKGKLDEPLASPFYLMNFAGKKNTIIPEVSQNLFHKERIDEYTPLDIVDNDIVLSKAALEGADVWIEEKMSRYSIFLSGSLGDAIKAAKPKSRIYMSKCQVQ